MLIGIAEHNAYHAGQIALLRRAMAPTPGESPRTRGVELDGT
jgi:hypothetical protein